MIKYLIKTTEEYWLSTRDDVENFHRAIQEDGEKQGYQVAAFGYTEKSIKEGKEVIDNYYIVKVTKLFDDAKEPEEAPLNQITYDRSNAFRDSDGM